MGFLIAEILGLLAIAALFGGAFVYWWLRRDFVDVSSEYSRYERALADLEGLRGARAEADRRSAALEGEKAQLERRLQDELSWRNGVESKLDDLQKAIGGLENTDVSGIEAGVAAVSKAVAAIKPTSLDPVVAKLDGMGRHVTALRNTDLSGVQVGLNTMADSLDELEGKILGRLPTNLSTVPTRLEDIDKRVATLHNADLSPVSERLEDIDKRVAALHNADLSPVSERLEDIDKRVATLRNADLSSVWRRLDAIEKILAKRATPLAEHRPASPPSRREPPAAGGLLKSASFGKPDDLKRIKGIGPKLEKMLNDIGVYYFFQIEAWKKADVERVDDLLEAFKGRIERDEWVKQARGLTQQPGAAEPR